MLFEPSGIVVQSLWIQAPVEFVSRKHHVLQVLVKSFLLGTKQINSRLRPEADPEIVIGKRVGGSHLRRGRSDKQRERKN
jgi:hypothetical protein